MPGWVNIPNALTLLRLLLTPLVIRAILMAQDGLALAVFSAAAVTDGLDGALARRFGSITAVGVYLDPIADKALLSGAFIALALSGKMPVWFVVLAFGRDLLILTGAAALMAFTGRRRFLPSFWGKLSTLLQSLYAVVVLVSAAFPWPVFQWSTVAVLWPAAAATIWSGVHYALTAKQTSAKPAH